MVVVVAERLLVLELLQPEDQVVVELDMMVVHHQVLQEIHPLQLQLKGLVEELEHQLNRYAQARP